MKKGGLSNAEGFERTIDNQAVGLYTISGPDKRSACQVTNYGGRVVSILIPDKTGALRDIALGYDTLDEYLKEPEEYMGAIVGRCANRIAAGLFVLDGKTYVLPANNHFNTLHGGVKGLHSRVWRVLKATSEMLVLSYLALHNEEGFPGNLNIEVIYDWKDDQTLRITYHATTDQATLVNLSNHTYFNLEGEGNGTVLDHHLQIESDAITPVDATLIPTGKLHPVQDSFFNFNSPRPISEVLSGDDIQLKYGNGLDHNFVLNGANPALCLHAPGSGIKMEISTDRPAMQVYTGNYLDNSRSGKSGKLYPQHGAVVVEPQGFPDAIHHPQFPSVVLRPGDVYFSASEYKFSS